MFFGLTVKGELKVKQDSPFLLSMAALEPLDDTKTVKVFVKSEGKRYLLCTLSKSSLNQTLNLEFEPNEEISFSLNGKGTVHLSGFSREIDDDDMGGMFGDSDEEDVPELVDMDLKSGSGDGKRKKIQNTNNSSSKKAKLILDEASDDESDDEDFDEEEDLEDEEDDDDDEDDESEVQAKVVQQPKQKKEKAKSELGKKNVLKGNIISSEIRMGSGLEAKPNKRLTVHYTGRLKNGKLFDSSVGAKPFKFRLGKGEVIKGWDIGMQGMKVGGKRSLIIPANMAYGSKRLDGIPANSTLLFDVELLAVN